MRQENTTSGHRVWVDANRCAGCGSCVEVCPVGAIALVDVTACIAEKACTGCNACVDACPQGAIRPVIEGELVLVPERPVAVAQRPSPLLQTVGTAFAVEGAGLLVKVVGALRRWLTKRPMTTGPSISGPVRPRQSRTGRRSRHRR